MLKLALEKVLTAFFLHFGGEPELVASAPGRVNLIGEHTDYTGGLVLPVAIDRHVLFAIRPVPGDFISGYSLDFGEQVRFPIGAYDAEHHCHWLRYVLGVLKEMDQAGIHPGAFEFCITGDIPQGAGLSSSAALEVATARAVLDLLQHPMPKREVALLCQRAENDFVGMHCGIMDQYVSVLGMADHALKIDCSGLEFETVAATVPGHTWIVIDSGKQRGLVDSEYNLRRTQCQVGLQLLQGRYPRLLQPFGLRALKPQELEAAAGTMDPVLVRRLRHIVTENARVEATCAALRSGNLEALGNNLYASHLSLKDDYEVSCPELDGLVDILKAIPGTVGARLTGAGFGGCVIALVRDDAVTMALETVREKYPPRFPASGPVAAWPIRVADGAKTIFSSSPLLKRGVRT